MTIVSGGLIMQAPAYGPAGWHQYLSDFLYQTQCFPHAVGIHPYDTTDYSASGQGAAIFSTVNQIAAKFDDAASRTSLDLWVTEVGCPSAAPFGEGGQSSVFWSLFGPGGIFASRPRCKAALIYKLYPPAVAGFQTYPVLNDDLSPKQQTKQILSTAWAGAP